MPWNGSGTFTRSNGVSSGTAIWQTEASTTRTISSANADYHDNDIASAINACLTKNGENSPSADLPMNSKKHTGVANADARTQYGVVGQIQDGTYNLGVVGGTADAITLTVSPAITAYAAGQVFAFQADSSNTGAATVNVSALGTKSIVDNVGNALKAGAIVAGAQYLIKYSSSAGKFFLLDCSYPTFVGAVYTGAFQHGYSTDYGSIAAAGTNRATGTAITTTYCAVASGTGGAVLPDAVRGRHIYVSNYTASAIKVYAYDASDTLNGTADGYVTVGGIIQSCVEFIAVQDGAWFAPAGIVST